MLLQITPAERTALQLLAEGEAASEIAGRLGLSASEVGPSLERLFTKMGAATAGAAVAAARRRGLLGSQAEV